jgi:hypothetical protein
MSIPYNLIFWTETNGQKTKNYSLLQLFALCKSEKSVFCPNEGKIASLLQFIIDDVSKNICIQAFIEEVDGTFMLLLRINLIDR